MNEEEKKAIQMLDKFITEHKFYNIKHSDNLEDNIEIVLNLIEKLQKENELSKKQVEYDKTHIFTPQTIKLNYIPIQKIKDKIKKNKNLVEESNDGDIIRKLNQENEVLQDLLEEEKQWEKYIKAGN